MRLKAPNRKWYAIGIYGGCKNCDAPAGVAIDLFDREQCELFDLDGVEVVEHNNAGWGVIDAKNLRAAAEQELKLAGVLKDGLDEYDLDEVDWFHVIRTAVFNTYRQAVKEREAFKKRTTTTDGGSDG